MSIETTTPIVPVPVLPPGLTPPQGFLSELRTAYATPRRAYPNWSHVAAVLERVGEVAEGPGWAQPREVWLAAIFHDAVYVAGARDNEARSAALARESIPRWFPQAELDVDRVAALVELTARHGGLTPADVEGDRDAALFLDCDTAILGATPAAFDAYDAAVRREYAAVPDDAYRAGRRKFLTTMRDRPRIFLSDLFHQRYDAQARENLARTLQRADGLHELDMRSGSPEIH